MIKTGKGPIEAFAISLGPKNLVLLKGSKGFVMCGYLNLAVAQKFNDVAIKITGVASIKEALAANVHSCTAAARRLGIRKGQTIRDVLTIIT